MGIIDTLSAGFNTVLRNLWLMTVPVLLDVGLWLAPKVTVAPVVKDLVASMRAAVESWVVSVGSDAGMRQMVDSLDGMLQQSIGRSNLLTALSWGRLGVPGIAGLRLIDPAADRVIELTSYSQWLGLEVTLLLVGLLIACVFLGMLGQQVRGEGVRLDKLAKRVPSYWLYMLALLLPLGALLFGVVGSSLVLGALSYLFWALVLWVVIYVAFVPQAITMAEARPLHALAASLTVVRSSFWPSLGLLILVNVISIGLGWVWLQLVGSTVGTLAAILLNAFVGTSLTAAQFIYFRDRLAALQAAAQQPRSA